MSKIRLHGTSSGYTDIAPTAAAGNNTLTAPTGTGTIVIEDASGDITIGRSIIHTGDTNTKINFSAADEITVETGGTEALKVRTDQRVQVTSGSAEVIATSGASAQLRLTADVGTAGADYWRFESNHSTNKLNIASYISGAWVDKIAVDTSGNINATGIVTATQFAPTDIQTSYRNKVINGAMTVSQRATSFSINASPGYTLDRFKVANGSSWDFDTTTTQETAGPDGFRKSLKITPDATDTPTGGENGVIDYFIEGQDCQDLKFGTSGAYDITVSFYAKSASQNNNHQYTFQAWHKNSGNTQYDINKAFTVTSSWQRFTITFPGNTSNNILFDNNWGMRLTWILAAGPDDVVAERSTWSTGGLYKAVTGQSNFMDNTSNEFHLTGVQLEVGSSATPFQHLSYGEQLTRCERYYQQLGSTDGNLGGDYAMLPGYTYHNGLRIAASYASNVKMRTTPAITEIGNGIAVYGQGTNANVATIFSINTAADTNVIIFTVDGDSSKDWGAIDHAMVVTNNTGGGLAFDSEL